MRRATRGIVTGWALLRVEVGWEPPLGRLLAAIASATILSAATASMQDERIKTELFLREGVVVSQQAIPVGITRPKKLTLESDGTTAHAAWKTVDEFTPGLTHLPAGSLEMGFRDSYKHEVAAYELDKMLGLGIVPVTVERSIDGHRGSLQNWVENAMSEFQRVERGIEPPDPAAFNDEMHKIRLLHQLVSNEDYENASNVLIDPDFKLWAIDHSRAFQTRRELRQVEALVRFSEDVVEKMAALTMRDLQERLGAWLSEAQLVTLLDRRDRIMARVDELIAEKGEDAVLY